MSSIHPTAILGSEVKLGEGVSIGPYCVLRGDVTIGDGTYLSSHVSIGEPAEHTTHKYELGPPRPGRIVIGSHVVIKDFVTINLPLADLTQVSNDCYISSHSYLGHDCFLEEGAIVVASTLGGWTRVMKCANIGLRAVTHQFTTVGAYAMVAAGAPVVKDIPPLAKYIPGKPLGVNTFLIKKLGLPLPLEASPVELIDNPWYQKELALWKSLRREGRKVYPWHPGQLTQGLDVEF